jgi:acetyltransferase-like isoleucine patch superfamily enzyme
MTTDVRLGRECEVADGAILGVEHDGKRGETTIGDRATIRSGTRIYAGVSIGDDFTTGHDALVREETIVGDDVLVGTNTVIDGEVVVGSHVSMQTGVYVPKRTTIGDHVFLGPHAVVTNDTYPIRNEDGLAGVRIEDDVTIGANAVVLPGVTVGERAFVAANATVTEDVPPDTLAVGVPAKHRPLPERLRGGNLIA